MYYLNTNCGAQSLLFRHRHMLSSVCVCTSEKLCCIRVLQVAGNNVMDILSNQNTLRRLYIFIKILSCACTFVTQL